MKKIIEVLLIVIVLFFGASVFLLSNHIGGWRAFIVLSPSMEPTIKTGSLIISRQTQPNTLKVRDIITFIPPAKNRQFITHRISKIAQNRTVTIFKTKGDKNNTEDSWILAGGGVVGKVVYTIPNLGYFMSFAQSKTGILLLILLPAAYIIVGEIFNIINTIKQHRKKNTAAKKVTASALLLILSVIFFPPYPTYALLSDSAVLANNTITVNTITPTPTPTETPSEFPSCTDPHGTIISSYETGMHEIIGVGLLKGSDTVYQLTEGSKEKVLQCYCPESGPGIQTNWIKTTEIERFKNDGWPYSITSGLSWNLDDSPYVAQNIEYTCN